MQIAYHTVYHHSDWRQTLLSIMPQLDMVTTDDDGRSLLHVICDPATYTFSYTHTIYYPPHRPRPADAPVTRQETCYKNFGRKVSQAFAMQGLRKGNSA